MMIDLSRYEADNQARMQDSSQGGEGKIFFGPPLALKMLLFYIMSTTCHPL